MMITPKTRHLLFTQLATVGTTVTLGLSLFVSSDVGVHIAQAAAHPVASTVGKSAQYGKLPLSFIANAGQSDPSIDFQVRGNGGTLSFAAHSVTLDLPVASSTAPNPDSVSSPIGKNFAKDSLSTTPQQVAIRVNFAGANPNAQIDGADKLPGIANFFIGSDSTQWHTNVPTYSGVVYHDLYSGVDLTYGGHTGLLKGTYTVAAGVDPGIIQWQYSGANQVSLDSASGDLLIAGPDGVTLREQAPIAWQMQHGVQISVTVGYRISDSGDISFVPASSTYDPALPLTIDPGLDYSTYLGGSGADQGQGIAVDGSGNAYIAGYTNGSFPTTTGANQTAFGGGYDAFVSKLNASGSALLYSTYLGGSGGDIGLGIAVDSSGNAYVTGNTSGSFPTTTGAYQTIYGGGSDDAFVSKLNASGSALVYSTYLGGSAYDLGYAIAVDSSGNAYISGGTYGSFPTTVGAYQTAFAGGGPDTFVSKLNASGSALVYSTYLGGSTPYSGNGIAVDGSGNVYVTGSTTSVNFPTTVGAYQTAFGGDADAFVSKLNAAGNALLYSTYLGGIGNDHGQGIAVDGGGNAYVIGWTTGNFPTTAGAYQTAFGGGDDVFVSKLNASGSALDYSTYLGGSGNDYGLGIAVDSSENAYVTGYTSGSFPTTAGAFQTVFGGVGDAFVSKLNPSFSGTASLAYSSYLGGSGDDGGQGIAVDSGGNAYVTGYTSSTNFPTTAGAFQTTFGGSQDAFVAMLELAAPTISISPAALPGGTAGLPYAPRTLTAITSDSLAGPLKFSITSGTLPPGLTLNGITSVLSGYPGIEGSYVFTVTATDRGGYTGSQAYLLPIAPVIGLTPASLPNPILNQMYTQNMSAYGGQSPYTFYALSGTLPTGLALNTSTGVLSGIPTANGVFSFTITAVDTQYFIGSQSYTLTVTSPTATPTLTPTATPTGTATNTPTATPTLTPAPGPKDTIGIYRPSAQTFFLRRSNTTGYADYTIPFGVANSQPVIGDWNGDSVDTVGTTANGQFTLTDGTLPNASTDYSFFLGVSGDYPLAGRWDNSITHDGAGVFRPTNGLIYLKDQLTTGFANDAMTLGIPGDQGLAGDWDANGFASPGIYRPSNNTFFMSNQVCNCTVFADLSATFGSGGTALSVAGDWTGSGHSGVGLFQAGAIALKAYPFTGNQPDLTFAFGSSGDVPIAGYWGASGGVAHPGNLLVPPTAAPGSSGGIVPGDNRIGG